MFSQKSLSFCKNLVCPHPFPPSTPPLGGEKVIPPLEPFLGVNLFLRHSSPSACRPPSSGGGDDDELTGGAAQSIQPNGGYIKNHRNKAREFCKKIYKKNFFARLFSEFMQIIRQIRVFQVNLQLQKLLMGFLTMLGKGHAIYFAEKKTRHEQVPLSIAKNASQFWGMNSLFLGAYRPKRYAADGANRVQGKGEEE